MYYIYEITYNVDGRTYIGKRACPLDKTPETDIKYMGSGKHIKIAEKKYGIKNFSKRIIECCYDENEINRLERYYIAYYQSIGKAEFNIAEGGEGGNNYKYKTKEEMKEHNKKLSESMHKMYNSPKGEELKKNLREKRKLQIITEETRYKMSKSLKGHAVSEETRQKLSEIQKGHVVSDETKSKISAARKSQVFSEESKQRRKESLRTYWQSEKGQEQRRINSERNKSLKQTKGKKWYTNGIIDTVADSCPAGFRPGRTHTATGSEKRSQSRKDWWNSLTDEERQVHTKKLADGHRGIVCSANKKSSISKANKGRKYYNNGEIEVMRFECPEGFVPGRCPKAKASISKGMKSK